MLIYYVIIKVSVLKTETQNGEETVNADEINTSFEVSFFSTYSLTWNYGGNKRATVHYGYMEEGGA